MLFLAEKQDVLQCSEVKPQLLPIKFRGMILEYVGQFRKRSILNEIVSRWRKNTSQVKLNQIQIYLDKYSVALNYQPKGKENEDQELIVKNSRPSIQMRVIRNINKTSKFKAEQFEKINSISQQQKQSHKNGFLSSEIPSEKMAKSMMKRDSVYQIQVTVSMVLNRQHWIGFSTLKAISHKHLCCNMRQQQIQIKRTLELLEEDRRKKYEINQLYEEVQEKQHQIDQLEATIQNTKIEAKLFILKVIDYGSKCIQKQCLWKLRNYGKVDNPHPKEQITEVKNEKSKIESSLNLPSLILMEEAAGEGISEAAGEGISAVSFDFDACRNSAWQIPEKESCFLSNSSILN